MAQAYDTRSLEFRLPDLGEGLTEAEIVRWLVEVGDFVTVDQPVVEVETAKAMVEVPCPYGGVVTARFGTEGAELPVGAPLLTVTVEAPAESGPAPGRSSAESCEPPGGAEALAPEPVADESSGNVLVGYGTSSAPARRRRTRRASAAGTGASDGAPGDGSALTEPATDGRRAAGARPAGGWNDGAGRSVDEAPKSGQARSEERPRGAGPVPVISPLVRRLARDHGLDLAELTGSGPQGLITRADVEHAVRGRMTPVGNELLGPAGGKAPAEADGGIRRDGPRAAEAVAASATGHGIAVATAATGSAVAAATGSRTGESHRVPLRGVRGAVAEKLSRSRREIPDATCWVDADATELMRTRTVMNAAGGPKISVIALLARICAAALIRHPELNSTVDTEAREVVRLDGVQLGFAAQTSRGLVVPVVREAQARNAESLSTEFARLTEAARAGTLTPAELTGGTFTLNNYGVFGVDGSTPIINHPEAAMLGVGRITPRPWVHEGQLAVRQVVQLSLTFDHRVCDGGTAGGFLRYVADCVEQPAVLLRSL